MQTTEITVCLEAISQYGCIDSTCKNIIFKEGFALYVPNTFTPDNDDYNPTFTPIFPPDANVKDYHLTIFDRWGEIVFESFNINVGWDGTYGVSNKKTVQDGVYVWKIKVTEGDDNKKHDFVGHVTLLK
jgi:gliding motility-associated-like protein